MKDPLKVDWLDANTPVVVLFRPVGQAELARVQESGFRRFPPRLAQQPIFYPVCNEQYAQEIARWNAQQEGVGYVTRFAVRVSLLVHYERHTVGARRHEEFWIPAEDLARFNDAIVGVIEVVTTYWKAP